MSTCAELGAEHSTDNWLDQMLQSSPFFHYSAQYALSRCKRNSRHYKLNDTLLGVSTGTGEASAEAN